MASHVFPVAATRRMKQRRAGLDHVAAVSFDAEEAQCQAAAINLPWQPING
jgi:hypothetical protein